MKRLFALSGSFVVLAAVLVSAQSRSTKTNVPFDFTAGGQRFLAGEYKISNRGANQDVTTITSADHKSQMFILGNQVESELAQDQSKLVFHKYGNQAFLREIWTTGSRVGRQFPMSAAERELARQDADEKVVVLTSLP